MEGVDSMKIMLSANIFKTVKHVKIKSKTKIRKEWSIPAFYDKRDIQRIEELKGRRLKILQEARIYKLRQIDVAKFSGISQASISGYVNNTVNPCTQTFYDITITYEQLIAKAKESEELSTDKEG